MILKAFYFSAKGYFRQVLRGILFWQQLMVLGSNQAGINTILYQQFLVGSVFGYSPIF